MSRFKSILCVIEPEKACKSVLERAVDLAANNQASLKVVSVVERVRTDLGLLEGGPIPSEVQAAIVRADEQRLGPLVEPYRKRIAIETKILQGTPFLQIIREVVRNGHDLMIKSPDAPGWLDRVFGSDDMHLLRKCPCPVWLVKAEAARPYRRILAAVDVDEGYPPMELKTRHALNLRILKMASSLALAESAELHVAHAWHAVGETAMLGGFMSTTEQEVLAYVEQVRLAHTQALHALLRELADKLGQETLEYLKPQTHLVKGWARKEIPALAKRIEADLIVMGTVARTGVPGFIIGNTAETILSQIDTSVLAIKPPGFVTPVTAEG